MLNKAIALLGVVNLLLAAVRKRISLLVTKPTAIKLPVVAVPVLVILNSGLMGMTSDGVHLVPACVLAHLPKAVHEHDVVNDEFITNKLHAGESH